MAKDKVDMHSFDKNYEAFRKQVTNYNPLLRTNLIPIVDELERQKNKLGCQKGCSWCCHYQVVARTYEIIAIYIHINTQLPAKQSALIKESILSTAKIIAPMSTAEHQQTNVKCPMLIDGSCSIYTVRPLKCAGYYSTNASDCEKLFNKTKYSAGYGVVALQEVAEREHMKINAVLQFKGHDMNEYEIVKSLTALFKNPGLIDRWRKTGKAIFSW